MEFQGKIILIFIQFISTIKLTSSRLYCEFGTCKSTEHCCGPNICCADNDVIFNVWIAVCVFFVLLFLCCSIFFMCRYFCRIGCPMVQMIFSNYRNLSRDRNSSTTNLAASCETEYDERIYSDPPPPYSEVVQMRK